MRFSRLPDRDGVSCVANLELIEPELFDYLRARVMESYFSHSSHDGNPKNTSWKLLGLHEEFINQVGVLSRATSSTHDDTQKVDSNELQ